VSEDSELDLDDGEDGEPGDSPESEDEEEAVPQDELASFVANRLAFSTEDNGRANFGLLVDLTQLLAKLALLISAFGRLANWLRTRGRRLAPLGVDLELSLALRLATRLCCPGIGLDVLLAHSLHVCDQLVACFR